MPARRSKVPQMATGSAIEIHEVHLRDLDAFDKGYGHG